MSWYCCKSSSFLEVVLDGFEFFLLAADEERGGGHISADDLVLFYLDIYAFLIKARKLIQALNGLKIMLSL